LWKLQWARAVEVLEKGEVGSDASFGMQQRPDGDLEIDDKFLRKENFNVPACQRCSGVLKPDVMCCLLFFHWFLLCLHLIMSNIYVLYIQQTWELCSRILYIKISKLVLCRLSFLVITFPKHGWILVWQWSMELILCWWWVRHSWLCLLFALSGIWHWWPMNVLGMCEMAPPALLCFSFLCIVYCQG
jgi:hypothetical protein